MNKVDVILGPVSYTHLGDQFFEAGFELRGSGNEGQPQRVADESQYRHGAFHARLYSFPVLVVAQPEWQSQYAIGKNKLAPHTYIWPYANEANRSSALSSALGPSLA